MPSIVAQSTEVQSCMRKLNKEFCSLQLASQIATRDIIIQNLIMKFNAIRHITIQLAMNVIHSLPLSHMKSFVVVELRSLYNVIFSYGQPRIRILISKGSRVYNMMPEKLKTWPACLQKDRASAGKFKCTRELISHLLHPCEQVLLQLAGNQPAQQLSNLVSCDGTPPTT